MFIAINLQNYRQIGKLDFLKNYKNCDTKLKRLSFFLCVGAVSLEKNDFLETAIFFTRY